MTNERSQAYGRVIQTLSELGPSKLLADEQDRLRDAADTLLFTEEAQTAVAARDDALEVLEHLVECGRWSDERASRLANDIAGCGPRIPAV
ncbi:MAG: hypothetical protein ACYCXW_21825 [Solirubrobacteraceae bacterium]